MTREKVSERDILIKNAVASLQRFGYPNVNKENIFTDKVFSAMFKNMLEDAKGMDKRLDTIIDELLSQLKP